MPEWLGKTIGKVRIDKYLAHGGMAEVYLGTHLTLDRQVAIKVLHSYIEKDPDLLARFQREAKVVAGLRHPNIVQIYDFDAVDGHPYIVMEYLKGPTLASYLRDLHGRNERIQPHQVARLLKALTASLDYAHGQGVIHRDIKPGNILLHKKVGDIPLDRPLTNDVEAILTDFGLVRIANSASQTASGMVSGTPAYMSPEQARGDAIDHRTDIYSLGIVLYEMLAGRVPFEADSSLTVIYKQIHDPPPSISGISPVVQKVIDQALTKRAEDRYPTASSMAVEFYLSIGMSREAETIIGTLPEEVKSVHSTMYESPSQSAASQVAASQVSTPATRKKVLIGVGIASIVGLIALLVGAFLVISRLTGTVSPLNDKTPGNIETPVTGPVSGTGGLPSPDGMIEIPPGAYLVGSSAGDEYHSPPKEISLDKFWIDKYQITYDQYVQFLTATNGQSQEVLGDGNRPVRGVTWDQALAYCSWVNKRLPTEAEWEAAGRGTGPNPQLYPWGEDPTANGQVLNLPTDDAYEIGSMPFNQSPFGVYDLVGNVWEWVGEPYAEAPADSKILRGGRFGLPILDLAYRLSVSPDDERYVKFAGFRCAADQVK
ncbi:MAG: bifunctional serine/threonine-protein kinase/formylglycine-generating enzyme family protein [Anaerolineales bacterium]